MIWGPLGAPRHGHRSHPTRCLSSPFMSSARLEKRLHAAESRFQAKLAEVKDELLQKIDVLGAQLEKLQSERDLVVPTSEAAHATGDDHADLPDVTEADLPDVCADAMDAILPGQLLEQPPTDRRRPESSSSGVLSAQTTGSSLHRETDRDQGQRRSTSVRDMPVQRLSQWAYFVQRSDEFEEVVALEDSTWNVIMISESSFSADLLAAYVIHFCVIVMQVYFVWMCSTDAFQGGKFQNRLAAARDWRINSGHAFQNLDSFDRSLTTRICAGDGSLSTSSDHRDVLTDLNHYMGLSSIETDEKFLRPDSFTPGGLLCFVSIGIWSCTALAEFRSICEISGGVLSIPRGDRTTYSGFALRTISNARARCFFIGSLFRVVGLLSLLVFGATWLANTTAVEDLVLNAVALEAVLNLDKILFGAIMPAVVRKEIQSLGSFKLQYSRRRQVMELLLIYGYVLSLPLFVYFVFVSPVQNDLRVLKETYCNGTTNFAWHWSPDMQMVSFAPTNYFNSSMHLQDKELALTKASVEDIMRLPDGGDLTLRASGMDGVNGLTSFTTLLAEQFASSFVNAAPGRCVDFNTQTHYDYFRRALASLKFRLGSDRCADLKEFCNHQKENLLRLTCAGTCGCDGMGGEFQYRTVNFACPAGCLKNISKSCTDLPPNQDWRASWQGWLNYTIHRNTLSTTSDLFRRVDSIVNNLSQAGCPYLRQTPQDPVTGDVFCYGSTSFAPLSIACPISCGCLNRSQGNGQMICPDACSER
eukprot:TRINITY_DN11509_c0_g1_i4.p1 TRINITY_DN11509_c0_g1~~TRINITY_DN11509_c0_g1_i4.p1  ORF type:complete len:758 (-),score=108.48 TRINITY_DN11509_c0_g1_i4:204-2477(-)